MDRNDDRENEYEATEAQASPSRGSLILLMAVLGLLFGWAGGSVTVGLMAIIWVVVAYYSPYPDFNFWHGLVLLALLVPLVLGLYAIRLDNETCVTITILAGILLTLIDSARIRAWR